MKTLKFLVTTLFILITSACFAQYVPDPNIWKEYFPPNKKGIIYYAPDKIECDQDGAYFWTLWAENSDKDIYHLYRWRVSFPEKYIDDSYYKKVNGKTGKVLTEHNIEADYNSGSIQRNPKHYTHKYYIGFERIVNEAYDKWLWKYQPTNAK